MAPRIDTVAYSLLNSQSLPDVKFNPASVCVEEPVDFFVDASSGGKSEELKALVSPYLTEMNRVYWKELPNLPPEVSKEMLRLFVVEAAMRAAQNHLTEEAQRKKIDSSIVASALHYIDDAVFPDAEAVLPLIISVLVALFISGCVVSAPGGPWDDDNDGYVGKPGKEGDCNDKNPKIHPHAKDIPCNSVDEDCDGKDAVPPNGTCDSQNGRDAGHSDDRDAGQDGGRHFPDAPFEDGGVESEDGGVESEDGGVESEDGGVENDDGGVESDDGGDAAVTADAGAGPDAGTGPDGGVHPDAGLDGGMDSGTDAGSVNTGADSGDYDAGNIGDAGMIDAGVEREDGGGVVADGGGPGGADAGNHGGADGGTPVLDADSDEVPDTIDNCQLVPNPDQLNLDGDLLGDACDPDKDNDSASNDIDNCPAVPNPDQENLDSDRFGDFCDDDIDGDTIVNQVDNCDYNENTGQENLDSDEFGDTCDPDMDGDGKANTAEGNGDVDGDGVINYRDPNDNDGPLGDLDSDGLNNGAETLLGTLPTSDDSDGDGIHDGVEVGGNLENPINTDSDDKIDALDTDDDGDNVLTADELRLGTNYLDADSDGDGIGDLAEIGADVLVPLDTNGNGLINALDPDDDGDGKLTEVEGTGDIDGDETPNYLDAHDNDGPLGDLDSDGIKNGRESEIGTNPLDDDSDNDGFKDGIEVGTNLAQPRDTDGDGTVDALDTDDDGDGVLTKGDGILTFDDNCPIVANAGQENLDSDAFGDVCDSDVDGDGFAAAAGDCNDRDRFVNPAVQETVCNRVDDDCSAATLDNVDQDSDGSYCYSDCDDHDSAEKPGATVPEVVGDGKDNNCDGYEAAWIRTNPVGGDSDIRSIVPAGDAGVYIAGRAKVPPDTDWEGFYGYVSGDGVYSAIQFINRAGTGTDYVNSMVISGGSLHFCGTTVGSNSYDIWEGEALAGLPLQTPFWSRQTDGLKHDRDVAYDCISMGDDTFMQTGTITDTTAGVWEGFVSRVRNNVANPLWKRLFTPVNSAYTNNFGVSVVRRTGTNSVFAMTNVDGKMLIDNLNVSPDSVSVAWEKSYPGIYPFWSWGKHMAFSPQGVLNVIAEEGSTSGDGFLYTIDQNNGNVLTRTALPSLDSSNEWNCSIIIDQADNRIISGARSLLINQTYSPSLVIVNSAGTLVLDEIRNAGSQMNGNGKLCSAPAIDSGGNVYVGGDFVSNGTMNMVLYKLVPVAQ